jgi:hypothetical protein
MQQGKILDYWKSDLQYLYKQPTKKSQQSYDRLSNNTLKDMTTPFFMNGPEY